MAHSIGNVSVKLGICCVCQEKVLIEASSLARDELSERYGSDYYDEWFIDQWYGDSINFLVVEHKFYGERCDGSGQVPQVVLKD